MKKFEQQYVKNAEYHILAKFIMAFYVLVLSPFWLIPLLLSFKMKSRDGVQSLATLIFVVAAGAAWWYSKTTAFYMSAEGQPFKRAVLSTFLPVLVSLSLIPVIGPVFQRAVEYDQRRNPFISDEHK